MSSDNENRERRFYLKGNPFELMPDDIREHVPKIYEQDGIPPGDKVVHAAYFIPFKSNWTWYLTEYDAETHEAFGLVLGLEAEWGYFSLDELKSLGAMRLILEDFPKTFKDLKDTELVYQMTASEMKKVFLNTLSDEKDNEIYDR